MKIVNEAGVFKLGLSTKTSGGRAKMKWFKVTGESVAKLGFNLGDGEFAHTDVRLRLIPAKRTVLVGGLMGEGDQWLVPPTEKEVEIYEIQVVE